MTWIPETKTFCMMHSGVHYMDACRLPDSTKTRAYQTSMMNNKNSKDHNTAIAT